MSAFVLDASVTFAWCFVDEASAAADRLLDRVQREGAYVPALWPVEVANVLLVSERRGRIDPTSSMRFIDLLARLPISIDDETTGRALGDTLDLARERKLTVYDAAYLELARRRGLPLATRDTALRAAARATRVPLLTA